MCRSLGGGNQVALMSAVTTANKVALSKTMMNDSTPLINYFPRYYSRFAHHKTLGIVVLAHLAVGALLLSADELHYVVKEALPMTLTIITPRTDVPSMLPNRTMPASASKPSVALQRLPNTVVPLPHLADTIGDAAPVVAAPTVAAPLLSLAPPLPAANQPSTEAAISSKAVPKTLPISPPIYDADYLHNPAPTYPSLSRRGGEQGKVWLRVLVDTEGSAKQIEIATTSGFQRLDTAAVEAVSRWRFVSARQAERAVLAWVLVPINFSLHG
jgi:periplasmic protein TonB